MITNVVSAVAGVVNEPYKGVKKGGIKGGTKGLGKGMLGLVCKPVKGTIDLVTHTTRGISNTPKTMYVGMSKLVKTKDSSAVDPNDDVFVGEENGQNLYISKKAL